MNFNFHGMSKAYPVERPVDALLAAFAAGILEPAFAALIGAHLELRRENRDFVANLEMAGGVLLDDSEPVPLSERDRRLSAILSDEIPAEDWAPIPRDPILHDLSPLAAGRDELLPLALRAYVGRDFNELEWREIMPGLEQCMLATSPGIEASFLRSRAGKRLQHHGHCGLEVTLVLQGGYGDVYGHYLRGDIAMADESMDHRPVADPNEEGIFFVVRDIERRLTGSLACAAQRSA